MNTKDSRQISSKVKNKIIKYPGTRLQKVSRLPIDALFCYGQHIKNLL